MMLPVRFPKTNAPSLLNASRIHNDNSGKLVPTATINKPINNTGISNLTAKLDPTLTITSAETKITPIPNNNIPNVFPTFPLLTNAILSQNLPFTFLVSSSSVLACFLRKTW